MLFEKKVPADETLSCLLGCVGRGLAVVAWDECWFIEAVEKANSAITHIHADHYSGRRKLAGAKFFSHHGAVGKYSALE